MHIFAIRAFSLILDVLTFTQFVEFLKRSTVRGGRYFLIFQHKDMLNLCLNLNNSQPIYAYKHYHYDKRVWLHSSQMQTILVVNYIISLLCRCRNADLFVHEKLTKLRPTTIKLTFRKENFVRKNMKFFGKNFFNCLLKLHQTNFHFYQEKQ